MRKVHVPLQEDSYDVLIEKGLLSHIEDFLDTTKEYVIITDSNIPKEYIEAFTSKLNILHTYIMNPGETLKKANEVHTVIEDMLEKNFTRSTTLIAIGGGVVGDFTGFIASIYMRGIDFVQVPTSLLAQVDSSVGGKVGINTPQMKNAVGSFHQPKVVLIDPNTLSTLEPRHFSNGMAELIKHGVIAGKGLFKDLLEKDITNNIEDFIYQSISIKRDVVIQDIEDHGIRQILNYGHTIGHALEQHSKYALLHGEAIALGMSIISSKKTFHEELLRVFHKYNLNIQYDYDKDELLEYIMKDKKVKNNKLSLILVEELGNALIKPIDLNKMKDYM